MAIKSMGLQFSGNAKLKQPPKALSKQGGNCFGYGCTFMTEGETIEAFLPVETSQKLLPLLVPGQVLGIFGTIASKGFDARLRLSGVGAAYEDK